MGFYKRLIVFSKMLNDSNQVLLLVQLLFLQLRSDLENKDLLLKAVFGSCPPSTCTCSTEVFDHACLQSNLQGISKIIVKVPVHISSDGNCGLVANLVGFFWFGCFCFAPYSFKIWVQVTILTVLGFLWYQPALHPHHTHRQYPNEYATSL